MSAQAQLRIDEKRRFDRDMTIGVTTITQLNSGVILEGVVRDVSDGGIKISGSPAGLAVGDSIDIIVVVNDQAVSYTCEIRHVDADEGFYGVAFQSKPRPLQPPCRVKHCMRCGCDFPGEFQYCSQCGQRLVAITN